jgi:uncharacterized phiE125 gp8 family phage protein
MTIATITPPAAEPVTLAEAKAHMRLETTIDDAPVSSLIVAARQHLEATTGLWLITQTLRLYLDDWPVSQVIQIDRGPVQSLVSATVYNAAGNPVALSLQGHVLDGKARPARFWLASQPQTAKAINGIEIDFVAGFGATGNDVPGALKRAMLLHIGQMYELRGAVPLSMQPAVLPDGYDRLVAPYCARRL